MCVSWKQNSLFSFEGEVTFEPLYGTSTRVGLVWIQLLLSWLQLGLDCELSYDQGYGRVMVTMLKTHVMDGKFSWFYASFNYGTRKPYIV